MRFLHRFPVLEAHSVHTARERSHLFSRFDRYEAVGEPGRFHIRVNSALLDGIRLSAVQTSGHCVRPVDGENATLLVAHRGLLETDDGRVPLLIRDGEAALPRPGARTTTIPDSYIGLVLQAPMAFLATRAGQNGEDVWHPARDWPHRPAPRLVRALRYVIEELDEQAPAPLSLRAARGMSRLLTDLLLDDFAASAEQVSRPPSPAGRAVVRRAEAILRARLHDAVSIVALAGELGVSTRSLQTAFQRHRGMTPRDFLASCRLEAVRERLIKPRPGETVTVIAHDCGVMHLGRFAAAYRARYGEAPSVTLARSLRLK
ncbi:AraC family transcriptional regulator [Roseomonas alkaliterrae]|uniref:AraC-like DNA-binding protein n=1 Tax=Neoroseomonas alkaliterrae TaxID=1452450 RepID=A0A840XXE8_9PROT|nr:AraC family transcriptional regulator [Neoroseomonas alkaliterrae]MBB5691890.1 AraC-like DNA-binding protein [Neoroseomonas alkaliterrae]MBR0677096.1 AraC family transcriptional regulator [Neoroseomonas alkaliterrae]